jgi:hypothetical protein
MGIARQNRQAEVHIGDLSVMCIEEQNPFSQSYILITRGGPEASSIRPDRLAIELRIVLLIRGSSAAIPNPVRPICKSPAKSEGLGRVAFQLLELLRYFDGEGSPDNAEGGCSEIVKCQPVVRIPPWPHNGC